MCEMTYPNFNLKATITKWLARATVSNHRVISVTIPVDVARQVNAGKRVWTRGLFAHSVTVTTAYGAFDFSWDSDTADLVYSPRYLAEKIYFYITRMQAVSGKKAA